MKQDLTGLLFYYVDSFITLLIMTFIGVFLADILFSMGAHRNISKALKPLLRLSKLPEELSIPMVAGLVGSGAGHAITSSLVKRGILRENEVICYNLVSLPFSGLRSLVQYTLPVAVASLGPTIGAVYVSLLALSLLTGMIMGIMMGRLTLARSRHVVLDVVSSGGKVDVRASIRRAASMAKSVGVRYAVVTLVLLLITYLGVFKYLEDLLTPLANILPAGPGALPIVVTSAINPTAAVLMAGECIKAGVVTWKEALIALFMGRAIFAATFEFSRHSFPFYVAIYPPRLALKLTLTLILNVLISTPIIILIVRALP